MKKKLFKELTMSIEEVKEIAQKKCKDFCFKCDRDLPNKSFLTANGCYWCDTNYYLKEKKK